MKKYSIQIKSVIIFILVLLLVSCSTQLLQRKEFAPVEYKGNIYLYGETHGIKNILEGELEIWGEFYTKEGMRHLFIEMPYYTAELLNLWMAEESDEIIKAIFKNWEGTAANNPDVLAFYMNIKQQYPETIFHGTDVGHQYDTIGKSYVKLLEDSGQKESHQYERTLEVIAQGKKYYKDKNYVYREYAMVENFLYELKSLEDEDIMGIYGSAHTGLQSQNHTNQIPCMANQLYALGLSIDSVDLRFLAKDIQPTRVDKIMIGESQYSASYFGREDLRGFRDFTYREFWRIEGAYEDLKDYPKTGDVLPIDNYPMTIESGEVFIVELGKTDNSMMRLYYRSDGNSWQGRPTTEGFRVN
jgi:hypothetical protein